MADSIGIAASAYRLPDGSISIRDLWQHYDPQLRQAREDALQIPKLKTLTLEEIEGVRVCAGERPGELALAAAQEVLRTRRIDGAALGLLIDYSTVSRDANGISLCYRLQRDLQAEHAVTIALGNGSCATLQLAMQTARAWMLLQPELQFALLFSEDRLQGLRFQPPFNVLGDGASALLLERGGSTLRILATEYCSMGKFCDVLGINHGDAQNFDMGAFENRIVPIHYKVIRDLVGKVLAQQQLSLDQIDLLLYQNMSLNDYRGLAGSLGVALDRVYTDGLRGHGHIFGADLVINLTMARSAGRLPAGSRALLISSGAGFSWGVSLVEA